MPEENGGTPHINPFKIVQDDSGTCCGPKSSCCGESGDAQHGAISRRQFLARTTSASAALLFASMPRWAAGSGEVLTSPHLIPKDKKLSPGWIKSLREPGEPEVTMGEDARTIGMPVGGIGAGQIYLCGDGSLGLWEIFNEHRETPHGAASYARRTIPKPVDHGLALYWKAGDKITARMLDQSGFDGVGFRNMHPVGVVYYGSQDAPVKITLEGFSPFIPLNAKDSGLPVTVMMVTVENVSDQPIEVGTASWLGNVIGNSTRSTGISGTKTNRIVATESNTRILLSAEGNAEPPEVNRPAILLQDFEQADFGAWLREGTAFGDGPTTGNLPTQQNVGGWEGKGFAASFRDRDQTVGVLKSPGFKIERRFINFLVGGGKDVKSVGLRLIVDGKTVRSSAGSDREPMVWMTWNVTDLDGKMGHIEIYDQSRNGWGHIQVDHLELADQPRPGTTATKFADFPDVGTMCWAVDMGLADASDTTLILSQLNHGAGLSSTLSPESYPVIEDRSSGIATKAVMLKPGDEKTFTHVLTWHFPNTVRPNREVGHYYASLFPSAEHVLDYVLENKERLVQDTFKWRDTYYDSTLPWWLLERIHLTSCCLATGTTMWWKSGRFWAWEGVVCCEGTCTHVYNYAQTIARLFPELEINLRENQDLKPGIGLEDNGLVGFRHDGKYAADGQCGTVLKVYREHKMSATDEFLRRNWAATKKVIDYAIAQDGNADGIMEGSQHNTYDVNFFGPNPFVGALYLAALRAGEEMARELNELDYADKLRRIYLAGKDWTEQNLWNGEYFKQIVDLKEHPEHQYGDGCLSDQLFGQNWAHQLQLGYLYSPDKVRKTLESVWNYNWAPDLGVYNAVHPAQRVFAEAQEAGLFNCTWPKSEHLDEGVLYRDEVWSGVEYQVGSHMVYEGMLTEGLAICRAIHDRYHPSRRNPFNEIECSDYYSRAMASWGVLLALSGYQYHGPKGYMAFSPKITPENFRCAFNAAEGWGRYAQEDKDGTLNWELALHYGQLRLNTLELTAVRPVTSVSVSYMGNSIQVGHKVDGNAITLSLPDGFVLKANERIQIKAS